MGTVNLDDEGRRRAVALMHLALELLDRAGEHCAAAHLQHAISVAEREPLRTQGDDLMP